MSRISAEIDARNSESLASIQRAAEENESKVADVESISANRISAVEAEIGAQTARVDDIRNSLDEIRPRIDTTISDMQTQFSATLAAEGAATTNTRSEQKELFDSQSAGLSDEGAAILASMEEKLKEAGTLVDVISITGTSTAFGEEAKSQKKTADLWSYGAIVVGLLAALYGALVTIFAPANYTAGTVARALRALAILGVAGYAANQSGHHRNREKRAKRTQLLLAALPPFIAPLEPGQQAEAHEKFVDAILVAPEIQPSDKAAITDDNITLLARVVDLFSKIGPKQPDAPTRRPLPRLHRRGRPLLADDLRPQPAGRPLLRGAGLNGPLAFASWRPLVGRVGLSGAPRGPDGATGVGAPARNGAHVTRQQPRRISAGGACCCLCAILLIPGWALRACYPAACPRWARSQAPANHPSWMTTLRSLLQDEEGACSSATLNAPESFEIVVKGRLSPSLIEAINGFAVSRCDDGETHLVGWVQDQARLHGTLEAIGDLNIELVSLNPKYG